MPLAQGLDVFFAVVPCHHVGRTAQESFQEERGSDMALWGCRSIEGLFIVRPESQNFYSFFLLKHLVHKAVLNIDTP